MCRQLIALVFAACALVACEGDGDEVRARDAEAMPRDARPEEVWEDAGGALDASDDDGAEQDGAVDCARAVEGCLDADAALAPGDAANARDGTSDASADVAPQTDADASDACEGLTTAGRCASANQVELCVAATALAPARREQFACAADERCSEAGGTARCVLAQACAAGVTRCRDEATLERCVDGRYQAEACGSGGCARTELGSLCRPNVTLARFASSVRYQQRPVREDLRDFGELVESPAQAVIVAAFRGDTLIDAVRTSDAAADAGAFALWLPAVPTAEDRLVLMAAATQPDGRLLCAVADPGHPAGTSVHTTDEAAPAPRVWSYAYPATEVRQGEALVVPAAAGSAALHVFDALRRVVPGSAALLRPGSAETLVAWLGLGTLWDCGSCLASDPVSHFGQRFLHQLWVDGSSDESYWSQALVLHELGHYLLAAYSHPPSEAGPHYLGVPTHPGLAFNEGFATFFSSHIRADPLYFDKQESVFFWFRIDARSYSPNGPVWVRPQASRGLFQLIDENEVAALLWGIRPHVLGDALLQVLAEPRLRVPPFERGYTERRWSDATRPEDYRDTRVPHAMLADYLDALRCRGDVSAAQLDQVLDPSTRFPYDSGSPRCR